MSILPSEDSRRKANELAAVSNDLMGKTLSAVSGLLTQTHEKVVNSHDKIDLIEQRLQLIMATKRIETEIFTVLSDRAGIDIKPQLGQMRGILEDSRWWDRVTEDRRKI